MTLMHSGGVVTDWLTAMGTAGAVIVALVLAYRQNAERVRVSCQVGYQLLGTGDGAGGYLGDLYEAFVLMRATNDGASPVTISLFAWRADWLTKKYWLQASETSDSARLPAQIGARGDEAKVFVHRKRLVGDPDCLSAYVRSSKLPWLAALSIKVCADTTTGRTFYGRPHREVLEILINGTMPQDRPARQVMTAPRQS